MLPTYLCSNTSKVNMVKIQVLISKRDQTAIVLQSWEYKRNSIQEHKKEKEIKSLITCLEIQCPKYCQLVDIVSNTDAVLNEDMINANCFPSKTELLINSKYYLKTGKSSRNINWVEVFFSKKPCIRTTKVYQFIRGSLHNGHHTR